jgi:hypothetical protein
MASKQRKAANEFTETFPPDTVQQWRRMVRDWEVDSSLPNPYVSKDRGKPFHLITRPTTHGLFYQLQKSPRSGCGLPRKRLLRQKRANEHPIKSLHQFLSEWGWNSRTSSGYLSNNRFFYVLMFEQARTVISVHREDTVKRSESKPPRAT